MTTIPVTAMMYISYIVKRTQIYLDDQQAAELARRSAVRGTTASKMIREAIDQYLAGPDEEADRLTRFGAALDATFGVAPYLEEGAEYVARLRDADVERDAEVGERRSAR
jgi:Arc/MetJ family transcription regulator